MSTAVETRPGRAPQKQQQQQQQQQTQQQQQHHQKQQQQQLVDQVPDEAEIRLFHSWIETICDPDIELAQEFVFNFVRNCSSRRQKRANYCDKCAKKGKNLCVLKLHEQVHIRTDLIK